MLMSDSIREHLEQVDPDVSKMINAWLAARTETVCGSGERSFQIRWGQGRQQSLLSFGVELEFAGKTLIVAFDSLAGVDPRLVGEPFGSLPKALRSLVIERIAAEFIASLPPAVAHGAEIKRVMLSMDKMPPSLYTIGFALMRLSDGAQSYGMLGAPALETLAWLNDILPKVENTSRSLGPDFPIAVRMVLGRAVIPVSVIRNLDVDDVIWVDEGGGISRHGVSLIFVPGGNNHMRAWSAQVKHRTVQLTAPYVGPIPNRGSKHTMSAEHKDIEVPVVFELGEITLPLGEIERMHPNQTFELEQDAALAMVKLHVFGTVIAEGKLIAIGRKLGVRLVRVSGGDKEAA